MKGIHCIWVPNEEVEELYTEKLQARYARAKQIHGTLGYHQFEPVPNSTKIIVKAVSSDVQGFEKQTAKRQ